MKAFELASKTTKNTQIKPLARYSSLEMPDSRRISQDYSITVPQLHADKKSEKAAPSDSVEFGWVVAKTDPATIAGVFKKE